MRRRGAVAAVTVGVAAQLARDRRRRPPEPPRDLALLLAARVSERDLLARAERQASALQTAAAPRAHAAAGGHPARALLAVRAHLRSGIRDELPALQRRPERLHHLRHLAGDEPRHPPLLTRSRGGQRPRATGPRRSRARRSPLCRGGDRPLAAGRSI